MLDACPFVGMMHVHACACMQQWLGACMHAQLTGCLRLLHCSRRDRPPPALPPRMGPMALAGAVGILRACMCDGGVRCSGRLGALPASPPHKRAGSQDAPAHERAPPYATTALHRYRRWVNRNSKARRSEDGANGVTLAF
jgi:hypothetical protein